MTRKLLPALLLLGAGASLARAEVRTKEVSYKHDGVTLKGFLAWDDAAKGKRPGVLVVHEWWGLNDYARDRAKKLAALGYIAFAPDMYGEGKVAKHPKEAGQFAGMVRKNVKVWQGRAQAGLKVLQENEHVDPRRIAAIGYCFGGSTALQLAYTGADLAAVVTFHGAPVQPSEEQAKAIKAKILICHGAADSFIPDEAMAKLRAAFEAAKVDYMMVYYGKATHSFTVPGTEKHGMGTRYNAEADHRSWHDMLMIFHEAFREGKGTRPAVGR
jgi:dienelactone hydrolase